ncbi:glycine betaine ABC transporter substrate-binding protein [Sinorhizobium americanum]|uniref:L-proline glycine betaine binding ABC transporter protein ProX n=1 Tax=Sinorhizobium americanum TaxID=194963 RepID=A0A1L3M060_9HYPH|nr:glycine betaine ABC transporter substrate-binding protein [Sinorhizobium americanum]APG95735.1 L-proline glycine betaine binding ABC transporter protein ProX [Sinorhizobium americanum]OAP46196.1 ABC transporter substrate-binding protein [Sinorhizobium americanum]
MRNTVLGAAIALPFAAFAPAAMADCGEVTIASMNWQSAEVLSNIDKIILNEGYGCSADIVVVDAASGITSQAEKGKPDIIPEAWVDLFPELVKAPLADGRVVALVPSLSDGGQAGWFIPRYMLEKNPNLNKIEEILAHPEAFPSQEDPSKGAIFNGPTGWGGTIATNQLSKAFDVAGKGFTVVDTGSAAALDSAMAKAYERKEPWLGFYWEPTSLLGMYDMVPVDFGVQHDAAEWKRCTSVDTCTDPKPNTFPKDNVLTLASKSFIDRTDPAAVEYMKARSWSNKTVNTLMAWMTENQATGEEGARHFLSEHPEIWTKWVSSEASERIKSSLE